MSAKYILPAECIPSPNPRPKAAFRAPKLRLPNLCLRPHGQWVSRQAWLDESPKSGISMDFAVPSSTSSTSSTSSHASCHLAPPLQCAALIGLREANSEWRHMASSPILGLRTSGSEKLVCERSWSFHGWVHKSEILKMTL